MTTVHGPETDATPAATASPPPRRGGSRRVRWLALALGLLLVLSATTAATLWWLDRRAEHRAAVAAATAEAADDVAALLDAIAEETRAGADVAGSLRLTLEEHLTVSQRTDEQLALDRQNQQAALVEAGQQLQRYASAPRPDLPPLADEDALGRHLEALAEAQDRAQQLGMRFVGLAEQAERWAGALTALRAQADRYVATVEGQPDTHDPAQLRRLWEAERAVLEEYRAAARAAADVPGLQPIANAYLTYVDHNAAFVEEAIALLAAGNIDAYNQRLREVYGSEDPFGFQAAVAEATEAAIGAGVLGSLDQVREDATTLLRDVEMWETAADAVPSAS